MASTALLRIRTEFVTHHKSFGHCCFLFLDFVKTARLILTKDEVITANESPTILLTLRSSVGKKSTRTGRYVRRHPRTPSTQALPSRLVSRRGNTLESAKKLEIKSQKTKSLGWPRILLTALGLSSTWRRTQLTTQSVSTRHFNSSIYNKTI